MKTYIKILLFTITLTMSFVFSGCSSSVNDTKKAQVRKTRTTSKAPVNNNPVIEDDEEPELELPQDPALLPLTLEAIDSGTILINGKETRKLYIKKNNGLIEAAYDSISVEPGDKISFYGYDYTFIWEYIYLNIQCTADCYVYGNVMSLLEYTNFDEKKSISSKYAFSHLFSGNSHIKNHETLDIILPATDLTNGDYCYEFMFSGCTSLTKAPELPATTLAVYCYYNMFKGCTSLTSATALPATTLAKSCYLQMFYDCTSLTSAPALPATTLADYCYSNMFNGCKSLTSLPVLNTTTLASSCYYSMFSGCTSLASVPENFLPATSLAASCYTNMFKGCKSLISAPALPATTLTNSCYSSMFSACTSLTSAPALPAITLANYCYSNMFDGCTSLTSAPELPATTLANNCYKEMFSGCTSLASVPENFLPATSLADYCYSSMFNCCTNLISAPTLPATTLPDCCYYKMFYGCSSLTSAPTTIIDSNTTETTTSIGSYSCAEMFKGCIKLETAPSIGAANTKMIQYCCQDMFSGCSNLKSVPLIAGGHGDNTKVQACAFFRMFKDCSSLVYIKLNTNLYVWDAYSDWLENVHTEGELISMNFDWRSDNLYLPEEWTWQRGETP